MIAYGREVGQTTYAWTESFYLNQLAQPALSGQVTRSSSDSGQPSSRRDHSSFAGVGSTSASIVPVIQLARQGQPGAIARYLSNAFSNLEIAVRARVEAVKKKEERGRGQESGVRGQGPGVRKNMEERRRFSPQSPILNLQSSTSSAFLLSVSQRTAQILYC